MLSSRQNRRLNPNRRINLSAVWTRPTDSRLVSAMDPADDTVSETGTEDDSSVESSSSGSSEETGERRRISTLSSGMRKAKSLTRKLKALRISKIKATKESIKNDRQLGAFQAKSPKPKITPEQLAKKWGCSIERAKGTLEATTQRAYRDLTKPFTQRLRTRQATSRRRRFRGT